MSDEENGSGTGPKRGKPPGTRSRRRRAADESKEGMGDLVPLHPARQAGLDAGVKAQVERGQIPKDPDYIGRRQRFIEGLLPIEELELEELERLQFKDRHGHFAGRPPKLSTAQQRALHAEWLRRIGKMYEEGLSGAIQALMKIIQSPATKDADRLRAIEMLAARAIGREPQTINVTASTAWPDALEAGIVIDTDREDVG